MSPIHLLGLLSDIPVSCVVAFAVAAILAKTRLSKRPNLNAFPTVGSSSWLGSWWAGIRYMTNAADMVLEGYKKYKGAPFKIATPYHWVVVISNRLHIQELRNAREDEISFLDATNEDINSEFTLGFEVQQNPYHIGAIRSQLTHNLEVLYANLRDEIVTAFDDILDLKDNGDIPHVINNNRSLTLDDPEWMSVPALTTVQQIVCRASNRSFVGLPLCRDPDFVALNIQHTIDAIIAGILIGFFPRSLKPLVARFATNVHKNTRRAVVHLRPIIEERQKYLKEYGKDWDEKPHDLLSWLMDEGGPDATVEALTGRILAANFAAIHTSSTVFTQALYDLAANPQYIQPLREEVDAIVEKEGWSKSSVSKMHKIDSFLRESIRLEGVGTFGMLRKARKDYTFSDGTFIPRGTRINTGLVALHYDGTFYPDPEVFDPFRFANMDEGNKSIAKHQFVSTSPEYLSFGHGRHACPGRFFAAVELKTILAHIVTTYDVKLEDNTTRPKSLRIGSSIGANSSAKVMFRKRAYQD